MSGQAQAIGEINGGPAWVLVGNGNTALGAGWVSLGRVPRVTRTPELMRQLVKNEVGQNVAAYGGLQNVGIEIEMQKYSYAILVAMVHEYADATSSMSMNTVFGEITKTSMCIVNEDVYTNGTPLTDLTTEWFPNVVSVGLGAMANQIQNGDDQQTYTVNFACLALALENAQAVTAKYELGWRGDAADGTAGTWSLPATSAW